MATDNKINHTLMCKESAMGSVILKPQAPLNSDEFLAKTRVATAKAADKALETGIISQRSFQSMVDGTVSKADLKAAECAVHNANEESKCFKHPEPQSEIRQGVQRHVTAANELLFAVQDQMEAQGGFRTGIEGIKDKIASVFG